MRAHVSLSLSRLAWPAWVGLLLLLLVGLLGWQRARAGDTVVQRAGLHGPQGVACAHCHADPHGMSSGQGAPARACQDCHGTEKWRPSLFTVEQHASTRFPLEGRHQRVACGLCHVDSGQGSAPRVEVQLLGMPMECAGCHVDRHRGKLGTECATCHAPTGFKPVLIDFDHAARTGFSLTGPHEGVACESCHQGDNGRALRVVQTATCGTCHTPSHADFVAGPGETGDCARCHPPQSETFAGARFDHRRETAFPLERRHAALGCADCHPRDPGPGGSKMPDERCQGCHLDVHSGQLGTACADCHRPDRWRAVRFDHDRTLFTLRGRHFVTPCASCHSNQRWVGLRTECWDCHALELRRAPASVPAHTQGLADCSACHQPWRWSLN